MGRAATRSGLACVLGCLLVLAGCSGLARNEDGAGSGSDSGGSAGTVGDRARASVTPAPVPTVENTTSGGTTLAPGLTESGVTGPDALFAAHQRVLDSEPHTVRAVVRATYPNGTTYYRSTATTRIANGGARYYYVGRFTLANGGATALSRYESWSNSRVILTASATEVNASTANASGDAATGGERASDASVSVGIEGNVTYERIPAEYKRDAGIYGPPRYGDRIYGRVSGADTAVRDRTDAVGPTYYVVAITGVRSRSSPAGGRFSDVRNASGRLLVSPQGFVREYRFTFTETTPEGETVRVVEVVEYSSVGWTIVPRPPWYDAAIAATNETAWGANGT